MSSESLDPSDFPDYYRDTEVRARMLQYCGAQDAEPPSAVFVAGLRQGSCPVPTWDHDAERVPTSSIARLWDGGYDIARSLWDRRHLVFLIELDYENTSAPAEPFLHPAEIFVKIEPAHRAVRRILRRLGIHPQIVMTGRGYQYTGVIPLEDSLVDRLAALAPGMPSWFETLRRRRTAEIDAPMPARLALASVGLGFLIEHTAHLVMREAEAATPIPVVLNGTTVGQGPSNREAVSIDFSHVGDPLDVRHFRSAFSTYQFHRFRPDIVGNAASEAPPLVALPRRRRSLLTMLSAGRDLRAGSRDSRTQSAALPDVTAGVERLRQHYDASALAAFHRVFYRDTAPDQPVAFPVAVPACLTATLEQPNDLLLKPEHIQHVVRLLIARGWSPRAIAMLVRQKYEEDHGWGDRWSRLDAQTRAEFDVRVFAGMVATGLDQLVDLNCVSAQEKGICPRTGCPFDLRVDRDRLTTGAAGLLLRQTA